MSYKNQTKILYLRQFLANESSLKMTKNTFLFHLKSSFHAEYN